VTDAVHLMAIERCGSETRVAIVHRGDLEHLFVEREGGRGVVSNIYRGRVKRVLPGLQAAFVDVGLERTAFLYGGDAQPHRLPAEQVAGVSTGQTEGGEPAPSLNDLPMALDTHATLDDHEDEAPGDIPIEHLLHSGQVITVQVSKDPIGTKGARLTTNLSLPGRLLVYLPGGAHVGVSRRITDPEECERLRSIVKRFSELDEGFIVRTAAEGASEDELLEDCEAQRRTWQVIRKRIESEPGQAPMLVWEEQSLAVRSARDLVTQAFDKVLTNDAEVAEKLGELMATTMPDLKVPIEVHDGPEPLMAAVNMEAELERALSRKVWLASGGFIVIDQGEALTAIDVNSGRFVGTQSLEDTVTQVNLEACREICRQLRVRDIGGIIVIDFIDMREEANRSKVEAAVRDYLRVDRARTTVLPISPLGLVEMTRKRVRDDLVRYLHRTCPVCAGRGRIKSATTLSYDIVRAIVRAVHQNPGVQSLRVDAHTSVVDELRDNHADTIADLEERTRIQVTLKGVWNYHPEKFRVRVG
jgi:ribonuclease G